MWGFVGVLFLLVGMFLVQAGMFESAAPPRPTETAVRETRSISVANPIFNGYDASNRPYQVSATNAVQDPDRPSLVRMDAVQGRFLVSDGGETVLIRGDSGEYNTDSSKLLLIGEVRLTSSNDYTIRTSRADIDVSRNHMRSDAPVHVTFDGGEVFANGMEMQDDGERIMFFNGVTVHFSNRSEKSDAER